MKVKRLIASVLCISTLISVFPKFEVLAEAEYILTMSNAEVKDSDENVLESGCTVIEGAELSVSFVQVSEDAKFVKWISETAVFDDETAEKTSFKMPSADTEISAEYVLPNGIQYEDSKITASKGGEAVNKAYAGDIITVTFHPEREETVFNGWRADGVTFEDPTSLTTTFVMPDAEVKLSALYTETYAISYDKEIISITTPTGEDKANVGDVIKVKYSEKDTQHDELEKWKSDQVTFEDNTAKETSFTMPEADVKISVSFNTLYGIKVTNGSSSVDKAKEGDKVTITAKGTSTQIFDEWIVPSSVKGIDKSKEVISFSMPKEDIELSASFIETKGFKGWQTIKGNTYYYKNGKKVVGWQYIDKKDYYFNQDGIMLTGLQKIKHANGNTYTYYFNKNGVLQRHWVWIGNAWYYFLDNGRMASGWLKDAGKWYFLNPDGKMVTGFKWIVDNTFYFDNSGAMATGWKWINNNWYYFRESGAMTTGWKYLNNKWYYLNSDGKMATGWKWIVDRWFYFENSGAMVTGWRWIVDRWFYFKSSGAMATGWLRLGNTYYLKSSGAMATGWMKIDNVWYYFKESGAMVTNGTYAINGKSYLFNANGQWIDDNWLNSRSTPYYIKVNRATNTITIYGQDYNNRWTIPVRTMYCSVGTDESPTPVGEYSIGTKRSWWKFNTVGFGRYVSGFCGDAYKFHSVGYWEEGDPSTLDKYAFNALGSSGSHGCVRLAAIDAWWIYQKCPIGTTVKVYEEYGNPGPLGWPTKYWVDTNDWRSGWDPTDPDPNNPWH